MISEETRLKREKHDYICKLYYNFDMRICDIAREYDDYSRTRIDKILKYKRQGKKLLLMVKSGR